MKDLLDKVEVSIQYNLNQSFEKGVAMLKRIVENDICLFIWVSCSRLLCIVDNSHTWQSLWPCIRSKLTTTQLRSAQAKDLLDNPLARELLMLFLASEGEMLSKRG